MLAWRVPGEMDQVPRAPFPSQSSTCCTAQISISIIPFSTFGHAENALQYLKSAWHRLDVWPDVPPQVRCDGATLAWRPAETHHLAVMVTITRRNGIHWTRSSAPEIDGRLKPSEAPPRVYMGSTAQAFDRCAGSK